MKKSDWMLLEHNEKYIQGTLLVPQPNGKLAEVMAD